MSKSGTSNKPPISRWNRGWRKKTPPGSLFEGSRQSRKLQSRGKLGKKINRINKGPPNQQGSTKSTRVIEGLWINNLQNPHEVAHVIRAEDVAPVIQGPSFFARCASWTYIFNKNDLDSKVPKEQQLHMKNMLVALSEAGLPKKSMGREIQLEVKLYPWFSVWVGRYGCFQK